MALSGRLQFIYENLVPGQPVWDFCCDHGYLGIEALRSGQFPEVYFVDQVPHIIETLEKLVLEKFPGPYLRARFVVAKGEELETPIQGSIVIAGVGAFTILKILENLWARNLLQAKRLILCPQRDEKKFSEMLSKLGEEFLNFYPNQKIKNIPERSRQRFVYVLDQSI